MLKRSLENLLLKVVSRFPAVGVIGPRQVGKTTLVRAIEDKLSKATLYLDLELPSDLNKLREPELYLRERTDRTIIFDEIQHVPELFPLLRALIDQRREPGRFIILGSASPELLQQSSQSLAGRIHYLELHPFHLWEVGRENQTTLWLRGGFPEAYLAEDSETAGQWLESFLLTYTERDLPRLGLPASPVLVRNLLLIIASLQGQEINYSMIGKSLGITVPTVRSYVDFLEHAFLIRRLPPYFLNIRKRLVRSPKVYYRDTGLLHRLLGIDGFDELHGHIALGHSWEGFVIQQILAVIRPGVQPYFYRTQDGAELDLLLVKGNRPVAAFEIKYTDSPKLSRGNTVAIQDVGAGRNFVVTPSSDDYPLREDVRVCSLGAVKGYLEEMGVAEIDGVI